MLYVIAVKKLWGRHTQGDVKDARIDPRCSSLTASKAFVGPLGHRKYPFTQKFHPHVWRTRSTGGRKTAPLGPVVGSRSTVVPNPHACLLIICSRPSH